MPRLLAFLIVFSSLLSPTWEAMAGTKVATKPKQLMLFTGKNFDLWEPIHEGGWVIEDGALTPTDIRKNNYLWTKDNYSDFILTVQYKLSKGANSGVFYRTDPNDPVQAGFEIQLLDGRKSSGDQFDPRDNGSIYGAVAPSKYNNKAAGEWNALLLYVRGPRVTVYVNGDQTATANLDKWTTAGMNPDGTTNKFKKALATLPRTGKIGLQYHGQAVAFRHIRLIELDANSPDLMVTTPRPPTDEADLKYWLTNMVGYHGFTDDEVSLATGLRPRKVAAERKRLKIKSGMGAGRAANAPLLTMPYPGGRHPRTGFLDGAIDPYRETKLSLFLPWDPSAYVVVDIPEAVHSNLGLTYLAHTHVPTIWSAMGQDLEPVEWERHDDGSFTMTRVLPNKISIKTRAVPTATALQMEMSLTNGTKEKLTGMRVQNCIMLRGAPEFGVLTMDNRVDVGSYATARNAAGTHWVITAWEPNYRTWGNDKCPCMHSDPIFPDCAPGETVKLTGVASFYEGKDIEGELKRLDGSGWRGYFKGE